jgi:hypothetical protein
MSTVSLTAWRIIYGCAYTTGVEKTNEIPLCTELAFYFPRAIAEKSRLTHHPRW